MCHGLIQGEPSGKITAGNLGPYWKERRKRSFLMSTLKHLPKRKGSTLGSFWMKLLRWESLSFISGIFIYSIDNTIYWHSLNTIYWHSFWCLAQTHFWNLRLYDNLFWFSPFKTYHYVLTCQEWMSSFCSFQMYSCWSGDWNALSCALPVGFTSFPLQCGAIAPIWQFVYFVIQVLFLFICSF